MKTTVIYHSADYDGIFCREIARKFLPDAELLGWNFGDPKITIPENDGKFIGRVYIMDLPPECISGLAETYTEGIFNDDVIWIDHHKSSIETYPDKIPGYRIDGVAACRLAWQWFMADHSEPERLCLPSKQDYIDRLVKEPLAVRLAGEYDIWDHRGDGDLEFQFGLDSQEWISWNQLLFYPVNSEDYVRRIILDGIVAMRCYSKRDADVMRQRSFITKWEGLTFLCLNTVKCNSQSFNALDVPETGHDALLAFYFNGNIWSISLYHAKHRTDLDLSVIAQKYGGGGHRGACGFTCEKLPFI